MKKIALALLASVALSSASLAQSSPGLVYGQIPSAAQWNGYFQAKQDVILVPGNSLLGNSTGSSITGQNYLTVPSCTGTNVGLQWTTNAGFGCAAYSFLSSVLPSGDIYVGNASNAATAVAPSGDVSITNTGAFTLNKIQGTTVSGTTGSGAAVLGTGPAISSPTITGTLTGPDGGTWGSGGINGSVIGGVTPAAISGTTIKGTSFTANGSVVTVSANTAILDTTGGATRVLSVGPSLGNYNYIEFQQSDSAGANNVTAGLFDNDHRFLIGYTTDQGGQKLQVNGNEYVSGGLSIGTTTPTNGGAIIVGMNSAVGGGAAANAMSISNAEGGNSILRVFGPNTTTKNAFIVQLDTSNASSLVNALASDTSGNWMMVGNLTLGPSAIVGPTSGSMTLQIAGTAGVAVTGQSGSSTLFNISGISSAAASNYLQVNAQLTGNSPSLQALGIDANINLSVVGKGTGGVYLNTGTGIGFAMTASGADYVIAQGGASGGTLTTNAGTITISSAGGTTSLTDAAQTMPNLTSSAAALDAVCWNATSGALTHNAAGALCSASLRAIKDFDGQIEPEKALAEVIALKPMWARYNAAQTGVSDHSWRPMLVAEDVEQIDKRLATYEDGAVRGVAYQFLPVLNAAAIQGLADRIDILTDRVALLEAAAHGDLISPTRNIQ